MDRETDSPPSSDLERWIRTWQEAEKCLRAIQRQEATTIRLEDHILALEDAFQLALLVHKAAPTSGLVEQQAIFAKISR